MCTYSCSGLVICSLPWELVFDNLWMRLNYPLTYLRIAYYTFNAHLISAGVRVKKQLPFCSISLIIKKLYPTDSKPKAQACSALMFIVNAVIRALPLFIGLLKSCIVHLSTFFCFDCGNSKKILNTSRLIYYIILAVCYFSNNIKWR